MTYKMFNKTEILELFMRVESAMKYMANQPCQYVCCEQCDLFINDGGINGCLYIKLYQICDHLAEVMG